MAQLGPGERFGEEALVAGGIRNATVRTLTNCTLMRLDKASFHDLVLAPVLKSVTLVEARAELSAGARWLDVRYPNEQAGSALHDSLDLPMNVLRQRACSLDPSLRYIACCDNGIRGSVAAFLVMDAGCDCIYLAGGLEAYPELSRGRAPTRVDAAPVGAPKTDAAWVAAVPAETTPGHIPDDRAAGASYGYRWASAAGSPDDPAGGAAAATAAEHGGSDDPEVQAAVLKARLAQARLELQEAEQAHAEEQAAKKRLEELIGSRSQGELARAQTLFAEAEAMRRDLEEARRRAEAEAEVQADRERLAAEMREAESRVADTHRHQQEVEAVARRAEEAGYRDLQGEREHVKAERERANALVAEAEGMKRELEQSKRLTEEEVDQKHEALLALEKSLRSDIDARLAADKRRLEADLSRAAGELAAAQREREAAEIARQAAAAEAERKIAEYRSAFERMHAEEKAKLRAEKARIEAEAERIQGVLKEARRLKRRSRGVRQASALS